MFAIISYKTVCPGKWPRALPFNILMQGISLKPSDLDVILEACGRSRSGSMNYLEADIMAAYLQAFLIQIMSIYLFFFQVHVLRLSYFE